MDYGRAFGAYDVRGRVGQTLDETFAYRLGLAYSRFLSRHKAGPIVVGVDARPSSVALAEAFVAGLEKENQDVFYLGLASTPLVSWYGGLTGAAGSVAITASHMGIEFNGFKLAGQGGVPLAKNNGLSEIADAVLASTAEYCGLSHKLAPNDVKGQYADFLGQLAQMKRPLKLAVDAGNGPTGPEIEKLLQLIPGMKYIPINMDPSAQPNRPLNPLDEGALDQLSQAVLENGCDFGAAFDGDGDRLVIVDERGQKLGADALTTILGTRLVKECAGATILFDLRMSRSVSELLAAAGAKPEKTRVGHSFIKQTMREKDVVFAGELSGHYYFKDCFYTDNALRALIEFSNYLSGQQKPLSKLVSAVTPYVSTGEINFHVDAPDAMIERLRQVFADGSQQSLDGLSVDFPQWWFNARVSKTEGVLRLVVGAINSELLTDKVELLGAILETAKDRHQEQQQELIRT